MIPRILEYRLNVGDFYTIVDAVDTASTVEAEEGALVDGDVGGISRA